MRAKILVNGKAQYLLRKLRYLAGAEFANSHQWVSEADRWKELVFALLTRTTKQPQPTVRLVTDELFQLELLQIPNLTAILGGKVPAPDLDHEHSRQITQTLEESGFTPEEAVVGLTLICEAASVLAKRYSGKAQFYLRSYAEKMLSEAQSIFQFSRLSDQQVRYAFTLWLQNVSNMPVSLSDESVQLFSRTNGLGSNDIFDAADALDINVALVDDLVHHFHSFSGNGEVEKVEAMPVARTKRRSNPKKSKAAM